MPAWARPGAYEAGGESVKPSGGGRRAAVRLPQRVGQQLRQLHRLGGIEAGIAKGVVALGKVLLCERRRAAAALGDILPRQLALNAAGADPLGRAEGEHGGAYGRTAG